MHAVIQTHLALLLFLPWFAILAALYWIYPRQPRTTRRRVFDVVALLLALLACVVMVRWGIQAADRSYGQIWQQVFATSVGYGAFLLVLLSAVLLRRHWLRAARRP